MATVLDEKTPAEDVASSPNSLELGATAGEEGTAVNVLQLLE